MYQLYWNDELCCFMVFDPEIKIAYRIRIDGRYSNFNDYFNNRLGELIDSEYTELIRFDLKEVDYTNEYLHD